MSERIARPRRYQDLHVGGIARAPLDFRDGEDGVLLRHHDAGTQPRLRLDPGLQLPVVDRARERRRIVQIPLFHSGAAERHQHADLDAVGIEMLPAHQAEVGAGRPLLGKRIHAHAGRGHARIRQLPRQAVAQVLAQGGHVLAPAFRQERMQVLGRSKRRVNVAVDDGEPLGCRLLPNRDVHRTVSSVLAARSPIAASSRSRG